LRTLERALKITFSSASKTCEIPSGSGNDSGACLQAAGIKKKKVKKKKRKKAVLSSHRLSFRRDGK
jgi:hypothetical protein